MLKHKNQGNYMLEWDIKFGGRGMKNIVLKLQISMHYYR